MQTRKYTVLLLYPNFREIGEGPETYQAFVEAAKVQDAIHEARFKAEDANCEEFAADDFIPLAVYVGHLEDVLGQANHW